VSSSAERARGLARLAAREDTPEHERTAAALQLARIIARDGLPEEQIGWQPSGHHAPSEITYLERKILALETIVEHNAVELRELRAEKAELESKLRASKPRGPPRAAK
jgi:hypothetical protein